MSKRLAAAAALCTLAALPAAGGEYLPDDVTGLTEHLFSGGPGKDGIPALTNPVFGRPEEAEYVREDDLVMGVFRHGVAKAYPENLGWWHEVINDEIGGQFISVTLCPLTGTALNFNATGDDLAQIEFGVSGQLINSNLVMYDRRDGLTLYPQMIYTGINGNFMGEKLELLPIVETTWSMWKKMYPGTEVALAGTGLDRYDSRKRDRYLRPGQYEIYPYGTYREDHDNIFFPMTTATPDLGGRILAKETVLGICRNNEVKSYPFKDIPDGVVINDVVGGDSLLVLFDRASRTAIPYSREVGGRSLSFVFAEPQGRLPVEFVDVETRSRWNMLGEAVAGELKGTRLEQIPAYNSMWFAWDTYWNGAPVWEGEGIVEELPRSRHRGGARRVPARGGHPDPELPQPFQPRHPHPVRPAARRRGRPDHLQRRRPAGPHPSQRLPGRRALRLPLGRPRRRRRPGCQRQLPVPAPGRQRRGQRNPGHDPGEVNAGCSERWDLTRSGCTPAGPPGWSRSCPRSTRTTAAAFPGCTSSATSPASRC